MRRAGGRSVGGRRLGRELYSGDGVGEGRVIWLYSYLFQIAWMWTATHVLCAAMLTWSLEVTINFAQDGIVNSL